MDPTSHPYNEDVKDMEVEEDYSAPHDYIVAVDGDSSCDICKIRLASIFQEEGNYCLECWQERTHPLL
jgi:hypothetical protein